MLKKLNILAAICFMLIGIAGNANAENKQKQEPKRDYITEAQPYLHLSCEGLVDVLGEDEEKIENVIGLMMAVSLINRNIDITKLITTEKSETEFRTFLEKALRKQCADDAQSLMVTNVDRAIAFAFSAKPKKKEMVK